MYTFVLIGMFPVLFLHCFRDAIKKKNPVKWENLSDQNLLVETETETLHKLDSTLRLILILILILSISKLDTETETFVCWSHSLRLRLQLRSSGLKGWDWDFEQVSLKFLDFRLRPSTFRQIVCSKIIVKHLQETIIKL